MLRQVRIYKNENLWKPKKLPYFLDSRKRINVWYTKILLRSIPHDVFKLDPLFSWYFMQRWRSFHFTPPSGRPSQGSGCFYDVFQSINSSLRGFSVIISTVLEQHSYVFDYNFNYMAKQSISGRYIVSDNIFSPADASRSIQEYFRLP